MWTWCATPPRIRLSSLTQLGHIRLGKRTRENASDDQGLRCPSRSSTISFFGGWDLFPTPPTRPPRTPPCSPPEDLAKAKKFLSGIKPMKAAFDREYVKRLDGPHVKKAKNKYELALEIKDDIARFRKQTKVIARRS